MKIKAFIPDWPGPKQHAQANASLLRPHLDDVTVLGDRPDDYFTDQWNRMVNLFLGSDANILFSTMADVWPPENVSNLLAKVEHLMSVQDVGIYAPAVEYVGQKLFRSKLAPFGPGWDKLWHVPMPEMLCWFVRRDVVEAMPRVDSKVNKYGWGIDYLAVAASLSLSAHVTLDDNFIAHHTKGLGYPSKNAEEQFDKWLNSLPEPWLTRVTAVIAEKNRVGVRVTVRIMGGTSDLRKQFGALIDTDRDLLSYQTFIPKTYDEWLVATADCQDLFVLEPSFSEDALRACQKNAVDNVRFLIPSDPREWAKSNLYTVGEITWVPSKLRYNYWRHPKWILNLTDFAGVPVAWLLPNQMEYR